MASASTSRMSQPAPSPQTVQVLVRKLSDADADFRFMSLNDLLQLLEKSGPAFLHHEYNIAARTVDSIIKALDDKNSEVQNLAIKCLAPLVPRVPSSILPPMLDKLSSLKLQNSVDSSIPSLALRSVIAALPRPVPGSRPSPDVQQAYEAIQRVMIPRLIGPSSKTKKPDTSLPLPPVPQGLLQGKETIHPESVDILIELVRCFGPLLEPLEVEATLQVALQLLDVSDVSLVVKKRVVVAVSMLAVYLNNPQLDNVVQRLARRLSDPAATAVTKRLYVSILGSMARSLPTRFGPLLPQAAPVILRVLSEHHLQEHKNLISEGTDMGQDFNEACESSLASLEAFLASCPQEMKQFTGDTLAASLRFIKYDPNCVMEEDDDVEMDDEQDQDDESDLDEQDGFDDDDDDGSRKVRRCAVRVISTLISTRSNDDLLENGVLYTQAAPALVKRIDEREENVRLEVISALCLLIRKTGERLHPGQASAMVQEPEMHQIQPSRKRRRQSSGGSASTSRFMAGAGLTSPTSENIPPTGPQADLARLTPSMVRAATKHLKARAIPTKQAIIGMLDDLVLVQPCGLSDYLSDIIRLVAEEALACTTSASSSHLAGAGGAASATGSSLRIAALRLISDICKTHTSSALKPHLPDMVDAVTLAVRDKFYKISSEALCTVEELAKTITPPRSKNSGVESKEQLEKLFDVLIDRGSATDADIEVRERAIHALGIIVSRTSVQEGVALLSAQDRQKALGVLRDRLMNETTRLAAVRAIENVAALATTPGQLEQQWVRDVAVELSGQLRKSDRTLRSASILALKHLVLSPASKGLIDAKTVGIMSTSLLPAIKNGEMHLAGPALVILAQLVPLDAQVVVSPGLIEVLCQLLMSNFANIVLDPLLDLMSVIGKSRVTDKLMKALLHDVSVSGGDLSVVGKVMGTLLVTGGDSTGHTLDSFINELKSAAKAGDEARVSLALAVLGEAGMRLGPQSPVEPNLFLEQFHEEPDRVSLAAAISLGRAGSGNVPKYLPMILDTMKEKGGDTRQYLLIQSIKEIVQSISVQSADLRDYARAIWEQLLKASEHEDNRVVCAESVGCLVVLDPQVFIPQLEALLRDKSPGIRSMAVQAVRYTLPESDEAFDASLKKKLVNMLLVMLQDSDMEIRRLALSTLNSAAHNKPDMILPHLNQLMPFVLGESVINPKLIKEVMLGPFKHTVDDGLDVRKSAYETLYALMETAFSRVNNITLYDRVVAGLKDDNDIRQLCNLMLMKLIVLDPMATARRLDTIAEAYRSVLSVKLKDNAVKQDVEKQEETNKSILRVTLLLSEKTKSLMGTAVAGAGPWASYVEWVNKEFDKQLKGLQQRSQELQKRMA